MTTTAEPVAKPVRRPGDTAFAGTSRGAGILILVVLAGVAAFLVAEALPAITAPTEEIEGGEGLVAYVWPLVFGTLLSAAIALLIATPFAIGIALFISHYAPRRLAAAPRLPGRPAGRGAVGRLRPVGHRGAGPPRR